MLINAFPIFAHVAAGIAHGVRIFAKHQRTRIQIEILFKIIYVRIHPAAHIHKPVIEIFVAAPIPEVFVMHGTAVQLFEHGVCLDEVFAPTRFVAERPDQHAGTVLIPLVHAAVAFEDLFFKTRIPCEFAEKIPVVSALLIARAMRFHVRFHHDINALFVAYSRKFRSGGIMAGAHGIAVHFL